VAQVPDLDQVSSAQWVALVLVADLVAVLVAPVQVAVQAVAQVVAGEPEGSLALVAHLRVAVVVLLAVEANVRRNVAQSGVVETQKNSNQRGWFLTSLQRLRYPKAKSLLSADQQLVILDRS
jgi:hypothetical protein